MSLIGISVSSLPKVLILGIFVPKSLRILDIASDSLVGLGNTILTYLAVRNVQVHEVRNIQQEL